MIQINQELDTQRKKEKRNIEDLIKTVKSASKKVEYEQILEGLKNSKYPLLKHEATLNGEPRHKLIQVKNVSPILGAMHELKERMVKVFEPTNRTLAKVFCGMIKNFAIYD